SDSLLNLRLRRETRPRRTDSLRHGKAAPHSFHYLDFLFRGRSVTKRSVRGLLRVLRPIAGLPHGVCAWPPTGDFASPPPCGWSRGDITTPRTAGRQPMRRLWPAPPTFWFSCSTLPSWPTVARQRTCTTRMPPDGRRICAYSPSFATSCAGLPSLLRRKSTFR